MIVEVALNLDSRNAISRDLGGGGDTCAGGEKMVTTQTFLVFAFNLFFLVVSKGKLFIRGKSF